MKVLVVIANYGTEQLSYLQHVVKELQSFVNYEVDIVINTNVKTHLPNVNEVIFDLPNFQYLPLTCKKTIWENRDDYDVFVFTENDHLILEHHLDKHLEYEEILPEDRITGLMQYEENEHTLHYPAYHARYDWDYNSVEEHGGKLFAHFTNLHQACFILSRKQLLSIGDIQDDFTTFFGRSHYSVKCKVNTDIYQFCGLKKLICISEFDLNMVHHLPNIYINGEKGRLKLGSGQDRMLGALSKLRKTYNDSKEI